MSRNRAPAPPDSPAVGASGVPVRDITDPAERQARMAVLSTERAARIRAEQAAAAQLRAEQARAELARILARTAGAA